MMFEMVIFEQFFVQKGRFQQKQQILLVVEIEILIKYKNQMES